MDYTTLRFLKWIAVFLLVSGILGAFMAGGLKDRQRAAYWLATPGFVLTWTLGFAIAETRSISMGSPWVSTTMLATIVGLAVTIWSVEKDRRLRWIPGVVAIGTLLLSTAVMTYKLGGTKTVTQDTHPTEVTP